MNYKSENWTQYYKRMMEESGRWVTLPGGKHLYIGVDSSGLHIDLPKKPKKGVR